VTECHLGKRQRANGASDELIDNNGLGDKGQAHARFDHANNCLRLGEFHGDRDVGGYWSKNLLAKRPRSRARLAQDKGLAAQVT